MGLPVESIFDQCAMKYSDLVNPEVRFPQDSITKFWLMIEDISQDAMIGLKIGQRINIKSLNVLGYSILSSVSIREGLKRFIRYQEIVGECINIKFEDNDSDSPQDVALTFELDGDKLDVSYHSVDLVMAAFVNLCRTALWDRFNISAMSLRRKKPSNIECYSEFFGVNVSFNNDKNLIVLNRDIFELQQSFGNENIASVNEHLVREYLLNSKSRLSLLDEIRGIISKELASGPPRKAKVACLLNVSPKTLQRRLRDNGINYNELVESVRKSEAKTYLANPNVSIAETSYLLGFSEPNSFYRAFKRWFGMTPTIYREKYNIKT